MIEYLLDTNICVAIMRGKGERALTRIEACEVGEVGISSLTYAELAVGCLKSSQPEKNRRLLERFVGPLVVVPFDLAAAEAYAVVRATLESAGEVIGPIDQLIAGHALSLQAILVTDNLREFRRVKDLQVENWLRP